MRKILSVFLILSVVLSLAAGLEISQKIKVVILPAKVSRGWLQADVDFLLSMLEEAMTELGRFEVYSRAHVKEIMKERGMAEMGITDVDAEELGKLAGAQYVILLTLNDLRTGWEKGKCWASAQLSIRLLDISDGRIVASKPIDYNTGNYYENCDEAKRALFDYIKSSFVITMREFFKLKATVVKVESGKAYLAGVDPNLLKVGMVFVVQGKLGKVGYVKITGEENGYVVAEVLYGDVEPGLEAKELAVVGGGGAFTVSVYNVGFRGVTPFGMGLTVWSGGFYSEVSYVMGSVLSYVPFDLSLGMRFNLFRIGRVFLGAHLGGAIFGVYDTDCEDITAMTFGVFAGLDGRYEFSPLSGLFFKYDYKYFLGGSGSVISLGYFLGF